MWWLNVSKPTEEEVRALCRAFGIHPLTIEDITTQESREKIELFPSYYFACFRSCKPVPEAEGEVEYEPFNIYVIVFREGTLSFSFEPNTHASDVRRRISLLKDYLSLSSDWICYALMSVYPVPQCPAMSGNVPQLVQDDTDANVRDAAATTSSTPSSPPSTRRRMTRRGSRTRCSSPGPTTCTISSARLATRARTS